MHKSKLRLEVDYWTWEKVVTVEPAYNASYSHRIYFQDDILFRNVIYIYVWYVCVHVILFQIKTNLCIFNTAEVRKIMFCVFFLLSTCKICTLLFVIVHYVETKTVDQVNDWQFCQLNVGLHVTYCTLPDFKYPNLLKYKMYNTKPQRFT